MGEVFAATRPDGSQVCLKMLRPELARDERYLRMFEDEVRLHAQLHHPHIVQVLDSGRAGDTPYLVLELVDGPNLEQLLAGLSRGEPLPLPASLHILHDLARGLDAAHAFTTAERPLQLVHRDVSPANVLLSRDGDVKLSDFGIAKSEARAPQTTMGRVRGRVAYMSPEQARGEAVDRRSDLFALGLVAYELLANRHPFRGATDESEVMTAHRMLLDQRAPLREHAPWLPRALCDEVELLLRREARARPDSANAFAHAISAMPARAQGRAALARLIARTSAPEAAASATHTLSGPARRPSLAARPRAAPLDESRRAAALSLVGSYLDSLPAGAASYPGCTAKGSMVRAYLEAKPVALDDACPPLLRELVEHPPVSGAMVPEVLFLGLALLVRGQHFADDASFLDWVKALNAQLFRGPLYRALMLVSSTRLLIAGAGMRWRQFHAGTSLSAQPADRAADLTFTFPRGLFTPLHVRLFASAIEAAFEAAGAGAARTTQVDVQTEGAHARISW